ncbi:hypothetical protein VVT58_17550 (plasmid) [Sphingobium sp. SJ10-10]|nr:hypothetical protein [Sphingobium sp. SJ10-10]
MTLSMQVRAIEANRSAIAGAADRLDYTSRLVGAFAGHPANC